MDRLLVPKKINLKVLNLLLALAAVYIMYRYRIKAGQIIEPFIIASVIAYLLNPIVKKFEKKGMKRLISVIIVYMIFLALILLFSFFLIPRIIKEIGTLVENIPAYSRELQGLLKKLQDGYINSALPESLKEIIDENVIMLQSMVLAVLQNLANGIIQVFSQLFNILIIPVISFYMLKDKEYFRQQMILLIPKGKRRRFILLFRDIDNVFGKYIRGQIIVAAFVGVATSIALVIIKVKYSLILGIFAGVSNIIPYFGPFIGIIPTIMFAALDSTTKALYAAGAFILIQQVESGLITPRIIGKSVGIHPVYVIMALIMGGKFFGVVGLIVAIPVLAAIKLTMRHVLRDKGSY